jgi:hypothetical protein
LITAVYSTDRGKIAKNLNKCKANLIWYADNIVITADLKTTKEGKQNPFAFLLERGQNLSKEKTCIAHRSDGYEFLR